MEKNLDYEMEAGSPYGLELRIGTLQCISQHVRDAHVSPLCSAAETRVRRAEESPLPAALVTEYDYV